jgi:hypothetical protein
MLNTHVTWECLTQGQDPLLTKLACICVDYQPFYRIVPAESTIKAAVYLAVGKLRNDLVVSKPINESVLCVLGLKFAVA